MNRPLRTIAVLGIFALPIACTAQTSTTPVAAPAPVAVAPASNAPVVTGLPDFTGLVQAVGPAVVNVSAEVAERRQARMQMPDEEEDLPEIFRRLLPPGAMPGTPGGPQMPQGPRGVSMGTGFLISNDGYVLTNHHVVDGADEVTIKLSDRREFKAKVVGSDQASDIALLKIAATGLPALRTGDSSKLRPGEWVVAIGSPFGLDQSVTAGVVSAVGRANPYADQRYVPFIQTDVAINRGNSGGPLLNTRGEVVGVNSQIFSNSGGYMGVSFAIPIDVAMNSVTQLKATGKVSRGQLGVSIQQMDSDQARALSLPDSSGALVADLVAGSPAARAGVERMDVIRTVNGRTVNVASDLPPMIGSMAPGSTVKLTIWRDGKPREITVTLSELNESLASGGSDLPAPGDAPAATSRGNALGLVAQDLAPTERQRLGLEAGEGVRITRVDGAAAAAELQPGDVILSVGRTSVGSVAALDRSLAGVKEGQTVMLLVHRGGRTQFVAVTAGEGREAG